MVSASLVAKSAGVKATNSAGDDDIVTVVTSGEGGTVSMSGTVCGNKAFLTGKMLFIEQFVLSLPLYSGRFIFSKFYVARRNSSNIEGTRNKASCCN